MRDMDPNCVDETSRERLPELVHGRLAPGEAARVDAHVAACAACAAELALLRRLSAQIRAATPPLAVEAITAAIVERTIRARPVAAESAVAVPTVARPDRPGSARERARVRWGFASAGVGPRVVRAAAAVVLVAVGAGAVALGRGGGTGPTDTTLSVASDRGAAAAALPGGRVAAADTPGVRGLPLASSHALGATFADLSDEELDGVLAALDESAAALVALEPASVEPAVRGDT